MYENKKVKLYENTKLRQKNPARETDDMELIKIKNKFQLTLPQTLRSKLGLAVGDYVKADVKDGKIVLQRVEMVPPDENKGRITSKKRQEAFALIEEIWSKTKDEDPREVEKLVREAVKTVRKSK